MSELFLDIITTTLLIAIPFTALYAAFWIWLNKYLEKRSSSHGYNDNNKNTIKFTGISYQSNNDVDFGFTYPLRNKSMTQNVRLRPTLIMSDKTILNYLNKKLIIKDDADAPKVYFLGEYMYQQKLWSTDSKDKQLKIARYVIEQNTVR